MTTTNGKDISDILGQTRNFIADFIGFFNNFGFWRFIGQGKGHLRAFAQG